MAQAANNDLAQIQETLMGMYDYIDGGIPCPYDTPQEWRQKLLEEGLIALRIIRSRMAMEAKASNANSEQAVTQAASLAPTAPQPSSSPETSDQTGQAERVQEKSLEEERAEMAKRRQVAQQQKRLALRDAIQRFKQKQEA